MKNKRPKSDRPNVWISNWFDIRTFRHSTVRTLEAYFAFYSAFFCYYSDTFPAIVIYWQQLDLKAIE